MRLSPADILKRYLIQLGLAVSPLGTLTSSSWPASVGTMPVATDRDNYISLNDTGALYAGKIQQTGQRVIFPTLQIMIRSLDYSIGCDKGVSIQDALDKIGLPPSRGGVGWVVIRVDGVDYTIKAALVTVPVTKIGMDETNRRQLFVINVRLSML